MGVHTEQEIAALEILKEKTEAFIGDVFDWVSTLQQQHLLGHLYDLQSAIGEEICKISPRAGSSQR